MNSDIESLAAISAGFKRGASRLEALRIKDIRKSDIVKSISVFDGVFESAKKLAMPRQARGLTKVERVILGVDR